MKLEFLPEGHELLKSEKKYWKLPQFKEGDTKFRIVSRPMGGWVDWKDNKPYRYRPSDRPKSAFDPLKPIKAFWVCYVWDYAREDLFILEITQTGVLKALTSFGSDADWGDFTGYDLKIHKEGTGKDTEYHVTPLPHKPLSDKIKKAIESTPVRLEALYDGGDPWLDLEPVKVDESTGEIAKNPDDISEEQIEHINILIQELNDQEFIKKLINHIDPSMESIYQIKAKDYDRVIRSLEKRRSANDKTRVA